MILASNDYRIHLIHPTRYLVNYMFDIWSNKYRDYNGVKCETEWWFKEEEVVS